MGNGKPLSASTARKLTSAMTLNTLYRWDDLMSALRINLGTIDKALSSGLIVAVNPGDGHTWYKRVK